MKQKHIILITQKDGTATQDRTEQIYRLLKPGYRITILDTYKFIRKRMTFLLCSNPNLVFVYGLKNAQFRLKKSHYPIIEAMKLRADALVHDILSLKPDCVICGVEEDMMTLHHPLNDALKIYDLPTPFADEVNYGGTQPSTIIHELERIEKTTLVKSHFFCANWMTYTKFLEKKYRVRNSIRAPSGCETAKRYARFKGNPEIAFVGNLDGYWTNLPLLQNLCKISNFPINIYGPKRRPHIKLPYKGYLKKHSHLADYQFGLITITNDPLRKIGFSAKHLLYVSYGLPVLCPIWRQDKTLEPATIYYNKHNFNERVRKYCTETLWREKHEAAMRLARQMPWRKTLRPLVKRIDEYFQSTTE
ncbi:MAG: hypothetical protein A2785_02645 [Candidatus Chisholmbacteria bacterium RIFCSPHIGHO2_01_FULL_49_18]|uniref:Uncharacterized protein n=1 Tax=Candidatus Chisholmbacteria bacterium RIFCSPHIGHO2_01_FULL_49_18 TaxID=1797590 RepID=A0A1G1VL18_9BACT|nr:MAG: hypothetical protein A2785_02645 [Candidatus Chisholmbacteria bacterium RIFCSPHIGHO2_01_FULL_49_18]HLD82014.1 hypothetical protein [Patescibacteria group bacterium]